MVKTLELNQDFCFIIGFASEDNLEDEIKYNLMKMNPVEEKEGFLSPASIRKEIQLENANAVGKMSIIVDPETDYDILVLNIGSVMLGETN